MRNFEHPDQPKHQLKRTIPAQKGSGHRSLALELPKKAPGKAATEEAALPALQLLQHTARRLLNFVFCTTLLIFFLIAARNASGTQSEPEGYTIELGSRTVIVGSNDTYVSIANREYGSSAYWRLIAEFNELNPVTTLEVGQTLKLPVFVQREKEFATIAFLKGEPIIIKSGESARELTKDDRIFISDAIRTGKNGFVSLAFRSGSVINIQPESRVQLISLRCLPDDDICVLGLNATTGEISSDVKRAGDQPTDFRILTPYASAAVRGTQFDFEASPDGMLVGVTEGSVAVGNSDTQSAVDTGFGVITATGKAPGDLVELTGPPTFRGIPARIAAGDKISWWKVPDSSRYIVSLASDAAAQQVISQSRQGRQVYEFSDISAGEYYLNVRPVDDNGLKGFGTTQKVNVVSVDNEANVFGLNATRDGEDVVLNIADIVDGVSGYEFQIATDQGFNDVISIDVGSSGSAIFRTPDSAGTSYFARARALIKTDTVSRFGPSLRLN